ncbi:MAG: hypothetical protein P1S60_15880 [Anaerolineae bacterium]|nr:hypothetical protein [Anaerolineae bacterium]
MEKRSYTQVLSIDGTQLRLDDKPFYFQGLSFFNALYNPTFNASLQDRRRWLVKFRDNGINVLRVWCQWDFNPPRTFVDVKPDTTMYTSDGAIIDTHFERLAELLLAADGLDMVIEVVAFSHEKTPGEENLPVPLQEWAIQALTQRLKPYRNLILQIWNEDSTNVIRHYELIKQEDPDRIVGNSPGFANNLGDDTQNRLMDVLMPHTVRGSYDKFWEEAPRQITGLLRTYRKPVIDDEPARCGLIQFGGIQGGTLPEQHIAQIKAVRAAGGYHTYHHDMFQRSYGASTTPPNGLPDPDFSPFHRQVFDYLRDHPTW